MASAVIRYSPEKLLQIRSRNEYESGFTPSVFLSHELCKPEPADWHKLLAYPVIGCWIAAREPVAKFDLSGYVEERNGWVVVLELTRQHNITIELKETDTSGNTAIICRPGPYLHLVDSVFSGRKHLEGYAWSFKNNVMIHVTAEDWITRLEKSGITRYRLENNRGRRYWVQSALRQFQCFCNDDVPDIIVMTAMLKEWKSGHEIKLSGGSVELVVAGRFLPTLRPECRLTQAYAAQPRNYKSQQTQTPRWMHDISSSLRDPNEALGSSRRNEDESGWLPRHSPDRRIAPFEPRQQFLSRQELSNWERREAVRYLLRSRRLI